MDAMTIGFSEKMSNSVYLAKWSAQALTRIRKDNTPDMVIGRPGASAEVLEDDGRTLVLPLPVNEPKTYACINETGGITLMLAEEY